MTIEEHTREANRDRSRRLKLLANPDCDSCWGRGQSDCNYIAADRYGEMICPCTGAAPYQDPGLLNVPIPWTRAEIQPTPTEEGGER